jgi:hypothetical protein
MSHRSRLSSPAVAAARDRRRTPGQLVPRLRRWRSPTAAAATSQPLMVSLGGGEWCAGTAMTGRAVIAVTITNGGSGCVSTPAVVSPAAAARRDWRSDAGPPVPSGCVGGDHQRRQRRLSPDGLFWAAGEWVRRNGNDQRRRGDRRDDHQWRQRYASPPAVVFTGGGGIGATGGDAGAMPVPAVGRYDHRPQRLRLSPDGSWAAGSGRPERQRWGRGDRRRSPPRSGYVSPPAVVFTGGGIGATGGRRSGHAPVRRRRVRARRPDAGTDRRCVHRERARQAGLVCIDNVCSRPSRRRRQCPCRPAGGVTMLTAIGAFALLRRWGSPPMSQERTYRVVPAAYRFCTTSSESVDRPETHRVAVPAWSDAMDSTATRADESAMPPAHAAVRRSPAPRRPASSNSRL